MVPNSEFQLSLPRGVTEILQRPHRKNEVNFETAKCRGRYIHKAMQEYAETDFQAPLMNINLSNEAGISIVRACQFLRSIDAHAILTEYPVTFYNGEIKLNGRIDLLAESHGKLLLIDYKTEDKKKYEEDQLQMIDDWSYQLSAYYYGLPEQYKPSHLIVLHIPRQSALNVIKIQLQSAETVVEKIKRGELK